MCPFGSIAQSSPYLVPYPFQLQIGSLIYVSFSSFPACYSSECGPVPISLEGGVPLEHLIMLSTYSFPASLHATVVNVA